MKDLQAEAATGSDARHALLARAGPVRQSELDLFATSGTEGADLRAQAAARRRLLPQTGFEVQEVEAKSALTRLALPGEHGWSLNPYMGCSHACVYCYVPDVVHLERARYGGYVIVKRNLPTILAKEVRRKEPNEVFLSSATDCYQPAEGVYEVTRRCLEVLQKADWPVRILTRNPLIRRDLDLITRFEDVGVGMSVPTLDDAARRILEPAAPPIAGRLAALRDLADAGLRPTVNLAPAYPFTGGHGPREIAAAFKDAGVASVFAAPWRYLKGVLPHLEARTAKTEYAAFVAAVQEPGYYDRMFRAVAAACKAEGLPFRTMW